ncbi:hypothetical protein AAVH_17347 [Aphelenchoides avenae]|nr:hypothetical protein AAVH_37588 [Aphelenchus avenae]KAH7715257.1 hypothetical protein AAVH_17347 [Aphelenchus avenae]
MTRKVFKSLYVIVAFEFFGWGSNSVYQFLQGHFWSTDALTPLQKWDITQAIGYLLCVATAVNGPVLYFCR